MDFTAKLLRLNKGVTLDLAISSLQPNSHPMGFRKIEMIEFEVFNYFLCLSILFALMQKESKKSRPNQMLRWFGRANAHVLK